MMTQPVRVHPIQHSVRTRCGLCARARSQTPKAGDRPRFPARTGSTTSPIWVDSSTSRRAYDQVSGDGAGDELASGKSFLRTAGPIPLFTADESARAAQISPLPLWPARETDSLPEWVFCALTSPTQGKRGLSPINSSLGILPFGVLATRALKFVAKCP